MINSIVSVITGSLAWTVLWLGTNQLLFTLFNDSYNEDRTTDSIGILLLTLAASFIFSVAAGWITAAIARKAKVGHATALGVLQLAIGIFVQLQYWDLMPLWYHLIFLALLLPGNVIGGRIRAS